MVDFVEMVYSRRSDFTSECSRPSSSRQLHGVGVFVQPAAVDHFAVARHGADGAVDGKHLAVRIAQRSLERSGAAHQADVGQVRRLAAASVVDAMTAQARAFALEDRVAARRVAGLHRAGVERVHVADISHEAGELGRVERSERRHAGVRKATRDHRAQLQVGPRGAELSAAQIHVRDAITGGAVAIGAVLGIQARAVLDIRATVIARMALQRGILRLRSRVGTHQAGCRAQRGQRPSEEYGHVAVLYPLASKRSSDKVWRTVLMTAAAGTILTLALSGAGTAAGSVGCRCRARAVRRQRPVPLVPSGRRDGQRHCARSQLDWLAADARKVTCGGHQSVVASVRVSVYARRGGFARRLLADAPHAVGAQHRLRRSRARDCVRRPKMLRSSIARSATRKNGPSC